MKRIRTSFFEFFDTLVHSSLKEKVNTYIKENVWIIPVIYIVGTGILLLRNKIYGLPFYPITLVQLAVIVVYLLVFLFMYSIIESLITNIAISIKKSIKKELKEILNIILYLIIMGIIMVIGYYMLFVVCGNNSDIKKILLTYYIIYPIIVVLFNNDDVISYFVTILVYTTLILSIPISMGGFKGQNVVFHDNTTNTENEYIYYGNYDGLYQFRKEKDIYLIPIENGYLIIKNQ